MSPGESKLKFARWPAFVVVMTFLAASGYWFTQLWLGPRLSGFQVARELLILTVELNGKVQAPQNVEIVSPEAGKIVSVQAAEGQLVQAGDVLIVMANKDQRALVEKARVLAAQAAARFQKISELNQAGSVQSLRKAQATLDNARKQYAKSKELSERGLISSEQLGDALRNLAIAQTQLATAQFQARASRGKGSDYALAESAMNKARAHERALREKMAGNVIKAETNGILLSRNVEPGNTVPPGKTLLVMSPVGKMQVVVSLDDKTGHMLRPGQQATIVSGTYPEQRFNARLSSIPSAADSVSGWSEARFELSVANNSLKQDMMVLLDVEIARHADALSLPAVVIRDTDSVNPWVMVMADGLAQRRMVKLGMRFKEKVEILEGLREGELVLPASGIDVQEGKRVRLARN